MIKRWELISKEYCFNSDWFCVTKNAVQLPGGVSIEDYYIVENKDSVMIVATDKEYNLVLKEEYRLPVDEILFELPAGSIEDSDIDIEDAAKRELLEETGYSSSDWELLCETYDCPDRCSSKLYLFWAKNVVKTTIQNLDDTEDISVISVKLQDAIQMCLDSRIKVNSCVHAIFMVNYLIMKNRMNY